MSKILVAYFSASGVTAKAARKLAEVCGGELFEIKPQVPYTKADLNWMDKQSRSTIEMNDPNSRPAIVTPCPDLTDYDAVFLGFPIWWYVAPTIIHTFLESGDFTGKTVIPFATSGSSGFGKTGDVLRSVCPNANWKPGRMVNLTTKKKLAEWVGSLGL